MTFTLEDYLVSLHSGSWFGFNNVTNDNLYKTYANLVIHDDTKSKPSESDCTAGVAAMQADWDGKDYARKRAAEYPSIADQLDDIYHNGIDAWKATIKTTKDKYPKP
jgi:hypothetical protein